MIQTGIAILTVSAMLFLAVRANRRFIAEDRLPMQWSLSGSVNWTAPRRVALAFMPVMAILVFAALVVMSATLKPRPGQEHLIVPATIFVGVVWIGVQALHFRLIDKTLRQKLK